MISYYRQIPYTVITNPQKLLMRVKGNRTDCSALQVIPLNRQQLEALKLKGLSFFSGSA